MSKKIRNAHVLELRHFPMDFARVMMSAVSLVYRVRLMTPSGKKYTNRIRGGAVLAANHYGFSDPLALFIGFWYRRVFFLAGELVMSGFLKRTLLSGLGAIRIDRNIADMEAIRRCVELLKEGHVVSVFPQGQITKTREVADVKHGAVLMALQAGVPVIPMYI
jgi:1-acyl-sn-glycerol-3-phosphate acyltransferase